MELPNLAFENALKTLEAIDKYLDARRQLKSTLLEKHKTPEEMKLALKPLFEECERLSKEMNKRIEDGEKMSIVLEGFLKVLVKKGKPKEKPLFIIKDPNKLPR